MPRSVGLPSLRPVESDPSNAKIPAPFGEPGFSWSSAGLSGCPDLIQEPTDFKLEAVAVAGRRLCRRPAQGNESNTGSTIQHRSRLDAESRFEAACKVR